MGKSFERKPGPGRGLAIVAGPVRLGRALLDTRATCIHKMVKGLAVHLPARAKPFPYFPSLLPPLSSAWTWPLHQSTTPRYPPMNTHTLTTPVARHLRYVSQPDSSQRYPLQCASITQTQVPLRRVQHSQLYGHRYNRPVPLLNLKQFQTHDYDFLQGQRRGCHSPVGPP